MTGLELDFSLDDKDVDHLLNTVELIRMPAAKRRRILKKISRPIIKDARINIRNQTTVTGQPFVKRKGRKRKKMLSKMGKGLVGYASSEKVDIAYQIKLKGIAGKTQQEGRPQRFTAKQLKKIRGGTDKYQEPATRKQAKVLLSAGYTVRRKGGKGRKKPTVKWITENLKQGQLWAIYREITGKKTKQSWNVTPPPRPYLGMSSQEVSELLEFEITQSRKG